MLVSDFSSLAHSYCDGITVMPSCCFAGNGRFFLSLLPPKKVLDAAAPVAAQLQFQPQSAEVVRLSEIMKEKPYHPSMTLQKALTRLAPTCRKLWNQMDWIGEMVAQVTATACLHTRGVTACSMRNPWAKANACFKGTSSAQACKSCRVPCFTEPVCVNRPSCCSSSLPIYKLMRSPCL